MLIYVLQLFASLLLCSGQNLSQQDENTFSQAIGNFSLELISPGSKENHVLSPFYVWKVLAATAEGANGETRRQLNKALRVANETVTRQRYQEVKERLLDANNFGILSKFNIILLNQSKPLEQDFYTQHYDTDTILLDLRDKVSVADLINGGASLYTHGGISKLVEESYFDDKTQMIITSAVFFKGEWKVPLRYCSCGKRDFYDSNGALIGEVSMLYNKYAYPFADIEELQAKVIELPCEGESLSLIVMLPNSGITVEKMFSNFLKVPLATVFSKLKKFESDVGDQGIEIYIPRFKTESHLDLKDVLSGLGVNDLFDPTRANLRGISSEALFVNKVIHKATIEVTQGTKDAIVEVDLQNTNRNFKFNANRPFSYFVVEKETNCIILGGIYNQPILF